MFQKLQNAFYGVLITVRNSTYGDTVEIDREKWLEFVREFGECFIENEKETK
jgi:hypothetical protein